MKKQNTGKTNFLTIKIKYADVYFIYGTRKTTSQKTTEANINDTKPNFKVNSRCFLRPVTYLTRQTSPVNCPFQRAISSSELSELGSLPLNP